MPPSKRHAGGGLCASCGRPLDANGSCPTCSRSPKDLASELAELDNQLSEMAATNVELDGQRKKLAGKMQAAKHQRDVLARALAGQPSGTRRPSSTKRRKDPGGADAGGGGTSDAGSGAAARRPPTMRARPLVEDLPREVPETSSRSVQAIMLILGALLLGIAAFVFVGVAITDLGIWGQLSILGVATVGTLAAAVPVAVRGLTATAEAISAVGVLLVGVTGYALWATGFVGALSGPTYTGIVALTITVAGYGYHRLTSLAAPRYGALVALQLVLPTLALPLITGPIAWSLVFTAVAAHNGLFGHLDRLRPVRARWQQYLAWVLHGLAVGAATGYAGTALALADTVQVATGAGSALVLALGVGVAGTLSLRRDPLPDLASGLMTLAVMVSAGQVALVAVPERALLPIAAIVAVTGLAARLLPERARLGPQLASAGALALLGLLVAVLAVRAGWALLVIPAWPDDLTGPQQALAAAAGGQGWQLAAAAATLAIAAVVSLPPAVRREGAAAAVAFTALCAPASLDLPLPAAAWLLVAAAAGLGMTGLGARTGRAALVHLVAAGTVGLVAAGASLASPVLTATILGGLTVTGVIVGSGPARSTAALVVSHWAAGGAAVALPAATAAGTAAAGGGSAAVFAMASVGVCGSLAYAARTLLVLREVPVPVSAGAGLGAVVVAVAALNVDDVTLADLAVSGLMVGAAAVTHLAARINATRRRDRLLDGADLAAAAVTTAIVATLARVTWLVLPDTGPDGALAVAAVLVAAVALTARAVPRQWRRGPLLGVSLVGALVAAVAATAAVAGGALVLNTMRHGDLRQWPLDADLAGLSWGPAVALALLAGTAAVVLPRPRVRPRLRPAAPEVSAGLAVLATVSIPFAVTLPWWGPAAVAAAVGTGYALSTVGPARTSTALSGAGARAAASAALGLYAAGASLARPWTTAVVLGLMVVVGVVVAGLTARIPGLRADPRLVIGGTAVAAALLAAPGAVGALATHLGRPGNAVFLTALATTGMGLAVLAALRDHVQPLLPYGTVGIAAGATFVALASIPTTHPTEVYAAAAVLLAVMAELVRAGPPDLTGGRPDPAGTGGPANDRAGHARSKASQGRRRTRVSPSLGALLAAAPAASIALVGMAPALRAALVDPHRVLADPWVGPPAELLRTGDVPATTAVAALLLTLAAALAAVGFGGAVTRQTVPVIAPGLAVTLLISPAALGAPWPASTAAALAVFTLSTLGVALTPPPLAGRRTRVLRGMRMLVLVIGLAGGSAGLAGSLADPQLTWGTFGGAVLVGAIAALGGRTRSARLLGWLGAAAAAQLFAVTSAILAGWSLHRAGLLLLAVAAVALLLVARLPRLRARAARPELAAVEWLGGYASLAAGTGLAIGSVPDVAAVLIGAGAVLTITGLRADRSDGWRRGLLWAAAGCEVGAIWLLMWTFGVTLLEAYTVPLAALALAVGMLEIPRRPELTSWVVYGPGVIAALAPSLLLVLLTMAPQPARQGWVLLGGAAALIFGARRRQRAPVILGSVVTAGGALHLLSLAGPWLVLIPLGLVLFILGANNERRQRDLDNIRGALDRMR